MFLICFCLFLLFFLGGFYDSSRGWRPGKEITPEMIRAVHMSPPPGSLELRVLGHRLVRWCTCGDGWHA